VKKQPRVEPRIEPRIEPREVEPPPPPPAAFSGEAYVDGGGDDDANERLLASLRSQLRGVKSVEVHGGALQEPLVGALKDDIPFLQIANNASVVIRFEGRIDGIGRGRKVREGHGTITKNGRVIFRYELPTETYRVGLPPTHAFARVLSDAFSED